MKKGALVTPFEVDQQINSSPVIASAATAPAGIIPGAGVIDAEVATAHVGVAARLIPTVVRDRR
jgi:hypothetical protein